LLRITFKNELGPVKAPVIGLYCHVLFSTGRSCGFMDVSFSGHDLNSSEGIAAKIVSHVNGTFKMFLKPLEGMVQ
jgi:hypothetical protein